MSLMTMMTMVMMRLAGNIILFTTMMKIVMYTYYGDDDYHEDLVMTMTVIVMTATIFVFLTFGPECMTEPMS